MQEDMIDRLSSKKAEQKKKVKYTLLTILAGIVILFFGLLILFNIYKTKNLMQEVLSGKPILVERYILNYNPTAD